MLIAVAQPLFGSSRHLPMQASTPWDDACRARLRIRAQLIRTVAAVGAACDGTHHARDRHSGQQCHSARAPLMQPLASTADVDRHAWRGSAAWPVTGLSAEA